MTEERVWNPKRIKLPPRGGIAVEFGLILPILLVILLGIVETGLALYDRTLMVHASREAARAGVLLRTERLTEEEISSLALGQLSGRLVSFGALSEPVVTVIRPADPATFDTLSVAIEYQFVGLGLARLLSAATGPIVLRATTEMSYE
jgi:Flp pilus assembly protein TadG